MSGIILIDLETPSPSANVNPATDVMNELNKIDEVSEVHRLEGNHDIFVRVNVSSKSELDNFVATKIKRIDWVKSTSTMLIIKDKK